MYLFKQKLASIIYIMKTTFVLPLATGKDIELAVTILFPSILHFFDLNDLAKIYLIMNSNDIELFYLYVQKTKLDIIALNIEIVDEMNLIDTTNIYLTYYLQMLLKLLIVDKIDTEYYITLDADLYFCKPCNSSFFFNNKAFYITRDKGDKWINRVEEILDIKINKTPNQTPFVFVSELVQRMLSDFDVNSLILEKKCSEYALYLGYLIKNNLLDSHYLERSFTFQIITSRINNDVTKDNDIIVASSFILYDDKIIGGIQSRINQHNNLIDTLKINIPTVTFETKKIGLLTVVSNGSYFNKYEKAFHVKKNYCKFHNYDFIFDIIPDNRYPRNKGWMKLYKLRKVIESYDYIFTSDADVIITNRDQRISDLIVKYDLDSYMLLITTDYNSLNTGNIIWRNCPETIDFIDKVLSYGDNNERYNLTEPYKPMGIYEQPTIIYFINKYPDIRDKIKIIPQFEMNSYLDITQVLKQPNVHQTLNGFYNRANWIPNDFIVHFAGMNYNDKLWNKLKMDQYIDKFVFVYKMMIIRKEGTDYGNIK